MTRKPNLYHNLANNEDRLTELLANLLQFTAFREVFSNFLAEKLQLLDFSFRYAHVETQRDCGKFGRPDLVIETASFCILIECKVTDYRQLTHHQPLGYLNYLDTLTTKRCALIFLIPYYYEHEALIRQRAAGSKRQPQFIYWTELIELIQADPKLSDQNVAIEHFVSHLRTRFEIHPITFSKEELMLLQNKEFPALLTKLFALIDEVGDKFPGLFKLEYIANEYCYGYYVINQNNDYLLWFGCSYAYWADTGRYFVIGVGEDDEDMDFGQPVINRFKAKFGQETWYQPWEWYLFPIEESLVEDPDNVKKLVHFIADVAEHNNGAKITTN